MKNKHVFLAPDVDVAASAVGAFQPGADALLQVEQESLHLVGVGVAHRSILNSSTSADCSKTA